MNMPTFEEVREIISELTEELEVQTKGCVRKIDKYARITSMSSKYA